MGMLDFVAKATATQEPCQVVVAKLSAVGMAVAEHLFRSKEVFKVLRDGLGLEVSEHEGGRGCR